ncbi:MAG TPA: OsmC family peroxiredoxin [Nocardioides sp.]|uniref:OsmC family peroxiredoxin n=1 Tax=Nocardioides sp. TaxID=35761 RepID=UPI002F42BC55
MADQPTADFPVTLTAGTLMPEDADGWVVPHAWTDRGVLVQAAPNGAGVLHVAVALCVLNDVYREGEALGVPVRGVRVAARGEFDTESWVSTGITYAVDVDSTAPGDTMAKLVARVDEVAEIPRVLRAGMSVERDVG